MTNRIENHTTSISLKFYQFPFLFKCSCLKFGRHDHLPPTLGRHLDAFLHAPIDLYDVLKVCPLLGLVCLLSKHCPTHQFLLEMLVGDPPGKLVGDQLRNIGLWVLVYNRVHSSDLIINLLNLAVRPMITVMPIGTQR